MQVDIYKINPKNRRLIKQAIGRFYGGRAVSCGSGMKVRQKRTLKNMSREFLGGTAYIISALVLAIIFAFILIFLIVAVVYVISLFSQAAAVPGSLVDVIIYGSLIIGGAIGVMAMISGIASPEKDVKWIMFKGDMIGVCAHGMNKKEMNFLGNLVRKFRMKKIAPGKVTAGLHDSFLEEFT